LSVGGRIASGGSAFSGLSSASGSFSGRTGSIGHFPLNPPPILDETVQVIIGGRPFLIGVGNPAIQRRQEYFANTNAAARLLDGEQALLDFYQIDVETVRSLLPEFFRALPKCQSDTKVFLKHGCEPVYQVLWMMKMSRATKGAAELRDQAASVASVGGDISAMGLANIRAKLNLLPRDLLTAYVRSLLAGQS